MGIIFENIHKNMKISEKVVILVDQVIQSGVGMVNY